MTVFLIIISILCILFGFAAFIVNVREKKALKDEIKRKQNQVDAANEVIKNYTESKKENEEKLNKIIGSDGVDSFNASLDLLQDISNKGKERNKK